jgi:hypothetical protein
MLGIPPVVQNMFKSISRAVWGRLRKSMMQLFKIWAMNQLERAERKTGFARIRPRRSTARCESIARVSLAASPFVKGETERESRNASS